MHSERLVKPQSSEREVNPQLKLALSPRSSRGLLLQRKCACGGSPESSGECKECEEKRLQRKAVSPERAGVPSIVHDVLKSTGKPLDRTTRGTMESSFGFDFGKVRIHCDNNAAESARAVNALAYAVGPHIVFAAGQYAPATLEGRRLLAHELTHVVQQRSEPYAAGPLTIGWQDASEEAQAQSAEELATAGANINRPLISVTSGILRRQPPKPSPGGNQPEPPLQCMSAGAPSSVHEGRDESDDSLNAGHCQCRRIRSAVV